MPNLMTRKKIWPKTTSINFPQTNNIFTKQNCSFDEMIVWQGHKLDYKYLKSITEDERDEIAKDLLNYFIKYDFGKFNINKKKFARDYTNLKSSTVKIVPVGTEKHLDNIASCGNKVCKAYFPNILKIGTKNKISVYDALKDKAILFAIIRNRVGNTLLYNVNGKKYRQWPMSISPRMIIQGAKCSGLASIGSIFKPAVARAIYNYWCKDGDIIYDYSCGFGGRLLGLMSIGKKTKYIGVDPNTETYKNLNKMAKTFKFNAEILCKGSEDYIPEEKINFAFSSPCYFTAEKYSKEKTQCYIKFPKYEDWLEGYWRATVKNIKQCLTDDGIFGVNVGNSSNEFMTKITGDFKRIILEEGFILKEEWKMKTARSHLTNKKSSKIIQKYEGIYFYGTK